MSAKAKFIEPMLLLRTEILPEDPSWRYEVKFDGYRALAIKTGGKVKLRSRNDKDFTARYPAIVKALAPMPDDTGIDGEVVALDPEGRPSFNLLQNSGSAGAPPHFLVFDVLILSGTDVMSEPLVKRRELLEKYVLPKLAEPIRYSPVLKGRLKDFVHSVKEQRLEGLIAKRGDSKYEPGLRSGAWLKMRVNQGQEFVIGGYTPSVKNFDALVIGYYGRYVPDSFSPDDQYLSYTTGKNSISTIWTLSLRDRKATPFADSPSGLAEASTFSPDGRWIAYTVGAANVFHNKVYVQTFPVTPEKYEIGEGAGVLWSRDGKQLIFETGQATLGAVNVTTERGFASSKQVPVPRGSLMGILADQRAVTSCRTAGSSESSRQKKLPGLRHRRSERCLTGSKI